MVVAINAKDVMSLRKKTGLGMMECKQALTETEGDVDRAIDLIRQKGLAKMDCRVDREASEGRIGIALLDDKTKAAIIELNSETDFTAGNDTFQALVQNVVNQSLSQSCGEVQKTDAIQGAIDEVRLTTKENVQFARGKVLGGNSASKVGSYLHFTGQVGVLVEVEVEQGGQVADQLLSDVCMHIAAISPPPIAVDETGVDPKIVQKEREIAKAQAMEQGKPEQIVEKIVEGKLRKFYEDHVLLRQSFIKDDKKQIKDLFPAGVVVKNFVRYQLGEN